VGERAVNLLSCREQLLTGGTDTWVMTQTLRAKQSNRELGQAGWILDYWVASLIAAVERAIRHRRAKRRARMQAANSTSAASTRSIAGASGDSNS
jgi:hypothetical protein